MKLSSFGRMRPFWQRTCQRLIECAVVLVRKWSAHAHSRSLVEVVGAVNDVGAKALGEAVDTTSNWRCPSKGTEKVDSHGLLMSTR